MRTLLLLCALPCIAFAFAAIYRLRQASDEMIRAKEDQFFGRNRIHEIDRLKNKIYLQATKLIAWMAMLLITIKLLNTLA